MHQLEFTSITDNERALFHSLMQQYAAELDEHQHRSTPPDILERWTNSIIDKQYDTGRCLRLCYDGAGIIGFLYGKIDQPEDKGYKRIGHGYIMEFYVLPEHRRKGYGSAMLSYLECFYSEHGVSELYLTADPVTGKPFWEAMGYGATGELSPDNGQEIYEKTLHIAPLYVSKADAKDAVHITRLYEDNIAPLHGAIINYDEWHDALSENDKDEAHFLIYKHTVPVAWLKINGLSESDSAWISMLAVSVNHQRQGIGQYTVSYAEQYCKSYGKNTLFIKTTTDNMPAQKLYQKCGYTACDKIVYATGDGIDRNGIVFMKKLR